MSPSWKEKREIFLRLGTHQYEKPAQLPLCKAVSDSAINRLLNAENNVEPVGDLILVFSEKLLYVNGFPPVKAGFMSEARANIIYFILK